MSRATELKRKIASLQAELDGLEPYETMSVRQIAKKAGISPATAHRFKAGETVDVTTIRKLISSGCVEMCPCCGQVA